MNKSVKISSDDFFADLKVLKESIEKKQSEKANTEKKKK